MILGSNQPALYGLHLALRRISQRKGDQAALGDAQTTRGELVARSNMRRGAKSKLLEHSRERVQRLSNPIAWRRWIANCHPASDGCGSIG
jgi:hypothetical protein